LKSRDAGLMRRPSSRIKRADRLQDDEHVCAPIRVVVDLFVYLLFNDGASSRIVQDPASGEAGQSED
jgi:hypothetical protein